MNSILSALGSLIDSDHIGGWTRSIVAAAGGAAAVYFGMQYWNSPEIIGAIGTVVSAIVVGLWSSLAKTVAKPTTP